MGDNSIYYYCRYVYFLSITHMDSTKDILCHEIVEWAIFECSFVGAVELELQFRLPHYQKGHQVR